MVELSGTAGEEKDGDDAWHADTIRSLAFDPTGRFLATAGDDKTLRLWRVSADGRNLACVKRTSSSKKVCATSFTDDGEHVIFANKYGDVHVVATAEATSGGADADGDAVEDADAPAFLLGHCCSIITDMVVPLGSNLVCTADRDHKVRVSRLPTTASVIDGSHEIQSFCYGHTAFVACVSAVGGAGTGSTEHRIVTGGGDGTARLWRASDGALLSTVVLAEPFPEEEREGDVPRGAAPASAAEVASGEAPREPTKAPAVTAVAAAASGIVVAAVEGRAALAVMSTSADGTLELRRWLPVPGVGQPTSLAWDAAGTRLLGAGVAGEEEKTAVFFEATLVDGEVAPTGSNPFDAVKLNTPPGATGGASVSATLHKKTYDEEEREDRKKHRNDKTKGAAVHA